MTTETYARLTLKNAYKKLAFLKKSGFYCRKLPTGNFSGMVTACNRFLKTFSLAKSFQTFKNARSRIKSFARCDERLKALPLESASFLKKVRSKTFVFPLATRLCAVGETVSSFKLVIYRSSQNRPLRARYPKAR